jgi:hypothetical protein
MNNNLTVSLALLAGLAGGMLTRFMAPAPVFAQAPVQTLPGPTAPAPKAPTPVMKEIFAESFALVDQDDNVVGTFAVEPKGVRRPARVVLLDAYGREIWSAGGTTGLRPLMSTTH